MNNTKSNISQVEWNYRKPVLALSANIRHADKPFTKMALRGGSGGSF